MPATATKQTKTYLNIAKQTETLKETPNKQWYYDDNQIGNKGREGEAHADENILPTA